jgi:hypothetical protein
MFILEVMSHLQGQAYIPADACMSFATPHLWATCPIEYVLILSNNSSLRRNKIAGMALTPKGED